MLESVAQVQFNMESELVSIALFKATAVVNRSDRPLTCQEPFTSPCPSKFFQAEPDSDEQ
jgi:hypothetical protein